jgi:UDP-3-O-[3-hydroxymyristoyl] glucosamine N-acyltransferase
MPSLFELARLVGGEVAGDGNVEISGISGLDEAKAGDISFISSNRGLEMALSSQATALVVPGDSSDINKPVIKVPNPRLAFAQLLAFFAPKKEFTPGIHASAQIGRDFKAENVSIGPLVCIGDQVQIGQGTIIYPGVVIDDRVVIGQNSIIHANVVIREDTVIGNGVQIHAGTVIGSDGFGYETVDGKHVKVPQVGRVVIEDEVEIGANVTIDRATAGKTLIKKGTKIDNLVQIAHNCQIGVDNLLCGQAAMAGSTKTGDRVILAGRAGLVGHIKVGDDSVVAASAVVISSLAPNSFVSGHPARPHAEDMRIQAAAGRLPDLIKEIRELQKKVAELEERITS